MGLDANKTVRRAPSPWWVRAPQQMDVLAAISRIEARLIAIERDLVCVLGLLREIAEVTAQKRDY